MFSTVSKTEIIILATINLSSANALNLAKAKICCLVKSQECFVNIDQVYTTVPALFPAAPIRTEGMTNIRAKKPPTTDNS